MKLTACNIFLIFFICSAVTKAQNKGFVKYKFVETLDLGEKNPDQREYMIGIPWRLGTDKENRIYYADRKFEGVRVYDSKGIYLTTLGRSGRGPGEFNEISDLAVSNGGNVLIFDRFQMRATVYENLEGDVKAYPYPEKNVVTPAKTAWISEEKYIIGYRNDYYRKKGKDFLHFVDLKSNEITDTAFPLEHFGDMHNPFIKKWIGLPYNQLSLEVRSPNRIVVAPFFYSGILYELRENNGDWQVASSFKGYVEQEEAIEYFPNTDSAPKGAKVIGGEAAVIQQQSLGLFKKVNGNIIHITLIVFNGEKTVFLEEFNRELKLINYGPITNIQYDFTDRSDIPVTIVSIDENDQFYLFDFREGGPEAAKVKRGYFEKLEK